MAERADNSVGWIVRRAAKSALAGALCAAGARWAVRAVARRVAGGARVLIVSYHRPTADFAADAREALPSLLVSTATMKRQLEQLAREREIISLDDACAHLAAPAARPARRGRVADVAVVTFDDGYADVHHLAFPILRSLRMPAVVYVATGLVGTPRRLVHDRLHAVLSELARRRLLPGAAGIPPHLQAMLDRCAGAGPASTLDALIARLPHDALRAVTAALEDRLGMGEEDLPAGTRLMSWDELRAVQAGGVAVGGHTVNHVALANVPLTRARAEIGGCREAIAEHLGTPPRHFAYPNGYYTESVRRAVAEHGFSSAVTTEDVENRRGGDPYLLKRKTLWENSTLGAVSYSPAVAACNLDNVFNALRWQHAERGERPDAPEEPAVDVAGDGAPERAAG